MADEETNFYNPDNDGSDKPAGKAKTAGSITWTASEYIDHERGASWYTLLVISTVALAAAVYFVTKDYFATITIAVLGIIVGAFVGRKPGQIQFELNSTGMQVGPKNYSYSLFKSFAIVQEGTLANITLVPAKRFMPPVSAYFDPKDQQKITDLVGEHLPYEERQPGTIDRLSVRLKL